MTTTSQNGFKIDEPIPDIEGGSKSPRALNNPVYLSYEDVRKHFWPCDNIWGM